MHRLVRFLHHHSLSLLLGFTSLCVGVAIAGSLTFGHHLIETQALQHSKAHVQTLKTSWEIYHSDVIQRLQQVEGVTFSAQYQNSTGAIPTPVAFATQLAQQLQNTPGNPQFFLRLTETSPNQDDGIYDPFQTAAQAHFAKYHSDSFHRVEWVEGDQALSYAEPLIMDASCIECHQALDNPLINQWTAGDLIGTFSVRQPLTRMIRKLNHGAQIIAVVVGSLACLGIFGSLSIQRYSQISQKLLHDELNQKNIALERLDLTDALTQVANRRQFDKALNQEWRRVWRQHGHLSLLICNIDYFEKYNERYGYPAGEQCLLRIAQTLQGQLKRAGDLVARIQGDEFYVLLPETSATEAEEMAAILLDAVHNLKIDHAQSDISPYLSISIGIASTIPSKKNQAKELIEVAQKAFHRCISENSRSDFRVEILS